MTAKDAKGAGKPNPSSFVLSDLDKLESALLQAAFFRVDENGFAGYVVNKADLTRRYVVELLLDGYPLRTARADAYVEELGHADVGDGCYGFYFSLPNATLADGFVIEARLANSGTVLGKPIRMHGPSSAGTDPRGLGNVQWLGGLRFEGWCVGTVDTSIAVSAIIDGETVVQVPLTRWSHIGDIDNAKPVRAFDLHLPERFADGRVRRAQFLANSGQELAGSPATFVAYPDGLTKTLAGLGQSESERPRAQMFDRLFPASLPFSSYKDPQDRFPITAQSDPRALIAVVMVGPGDDTETLKTLESQGHAEWVAAALPEAQGQLDFNPTDLLAFLQNEAGASELVLFVLTGTRLAPNALARFVECLISDSSIDAAYADLELATSDGAIWPLAFSAFDYERMLEQGYCAHLFAMRRPVVERALQGGASDLYRLFNSQFDAELNHEAVAHLPGPAATLPQFDLSLASKSLAAATVAHLNIRGVAAAVEPSTGAVMPAVHVLRAARNTSISIIIPVRNKPDLLRSCLRSIRPALKSVDAEIIIVDNDSSDPDTLEYLDQLDSSEALVLRVAGAFNYSRLNNIAAKKAHTEQLLLLNNDIQALDETWLADMQSHLVEPDVAAVGSLLLWPSRVIQHGGVVLGPSFAAAHAFNDRMEGDSGYADLLCIAHACSSVTAACLLVSRKDYLDVGGMDELHFPVNFNDVDLCLKFRCLGKRVIFTPHSKLLHLESSTRGRDNVPDRAMRFARELAMLRSRWGDVLANDPYYNPILSLDPIPFSALAWPPRDRSPRTAASPAAASISPGL